MVKKIGNGYVKVAVKKEELEDAIAGLKQLKPILQMKVIRANGGNVKQGAIDSQELGKDFDTAIESMIMLLNMFD